MVVSDFDMYTKSDPMAVGDDAYKRHTEDGKDNIIFNGVPDWVYEGTSKIVYIFEEEKKQFLVIILNRHI